MIIFGAKSLGALSGTVRLAPGYSALADASPLGISLDVYHELLEFQIVHNTPAVVLVGDPSTITYKVLLDGQDTDLVLTIAENASGGSVQADVDAQAYQKFEVVAVKNGALVDGVLGVTATIFDQI